jgi:hypothetical protein
VWLADGQTWGIPDGRYAVAYGPCSQAEAEQFLDDIGGVPDDV